MIIDNNNPDVVETLTTVLDPSKIKVFLYKEEPNLARLNGQSLELISTTIALFLKSIIETSTRLDTCCQKKIKRSRYDEEPTQQPTEFLITSTHLMRVISTNPSLGFLTKIFENRKDKDGSVPTSLLKGYTPVQIRKRTRKNLANPDKDDKQIKNKRQQLGGFDDSFNAYHKELEKVIDNTENSKESHRTCSVLRGIVADEDDYD